MSIILFQCLLDLLHPFAQLLQSFLQAGQALYVDKISEKLALGNAWVAKDTLAGLDGTLNSGFCADFYPVSNLKMPRYSDLSAQGHLVSKPGAACNADLGDEQAVFAHLDVVPNHDEIIDLCAALYPGPAKGCPINRGIGADLNVIVYLHYAGLRYFYMPALFVHGIPIAIRS